MLNTNYQKRNNSLLFQDLEKIISVEKIQNYIPIYNKIFQLNNTNYNNINLDNQNYIIKIINNNNHLHAIIKDISDNERKVDVFFKLSPLLDPVKYAIGKYDINDNNLLEIPSFCNKNSHAKSRDMNNSAYVDGFFSYLSSKLLHNHHFIHGLDFYGSFLGLKNNFIYNATDELELFLDSKFFNEHKKILFDIDERYTDIISNNDSRKYKSKLEISDNEIIDFDLVELTEIQEIIPTVNNENNENNDDGLKNKKKQYVEIEANNEFDLLVLENINDLNNIYVDKSKNITDRTDKDDSDSDCSSRTSHTDNDSDEQEENDVNSNVFSDNESKDDTNESVSYETIDDDVSELSDDGSEFTTSTNCDELINLTINKFPVSIICLEKCENTLDDYMVNSDISVDEWASILMQVIMILIAYQKVFSFTHNDLHTNNIMYTSTDKKYLFYKYNNQIYKVPTYGKIYKIIDFGRAIYKYNGFLFCSDSFHKNGDASTQYNFEPYMNDKKPRLEPNYSFDLCRLACSMYDIIIDDEENDITELINDWCKDDKGRNVLYKKNGDERYPDFKLYKMIARTVHNHTPQEQLNRKIFSKYLVSKTKISKTNKTEIMDIDSFN